MVVTKGENVLPPTITLSTRKIIREEALAAISECHLMKTRNTPRVVEADGSIM